MDQLLASQIAGKPVRIICHHLLFFSFSGARSVRKRPTSSVERKQHLYQSKVLLEALELSTQNGTIEQSSVLQILGLDESKKKPATKLKHSLFPNVSAKRSRSGGKTTIVFKGIKRKISFSLTQDSDSTAGTGAREDPPAIIALKQKLSSSSEDLNSVNKLLEEEASKVTLEKEALLCY